MPKANLQRKLTCRVLMPMVIGMTITLLTAYIPFYVSFPSWIDSITSDMISDRKVTLLTISEYLAQSAAAAISYQISLLIFSRELMVMNSQGQFILKPNFDYFSDKNFVNGRLFGENLIAMPNGFDYTINKSYDVGMWYLGDIVNLTDIHNETSLWELANCTIFDFFLRPVIKAGAFNLQDPVFQRSLTGFSADQLVHGLPTENQSYYVNDTIDADKCIYNLENNNDFYYPKCRSWFKDTLLNPYQDHITITEPYAFADNVTIGQTACLGMWDQNEFSFASCIDFSMSQLSSYINVTDSLNTTYAFAVSPGDQTFVHPNMVNSLGNITENEMNGATAKEIEKFNANVVPLFFKNTSSISNYSIQGQEIIIAISPVINTVSADQAQNQSASIGLRFLQSQMTVGFTDLKNSLNKILYAEAIALGILITIILICCWILTRFVTQQIIRPIDNLVEILDRMLAGDLDINIEEHYQLCAKEITRLYSVFTKLKIVLRFGKSNYFAEDSEAIMNYAQALSLFLEFRNMEGAGICYNNLGIIHYKNQRFHEAIECFAKALEAAESMKNQQATILKRKHMLATTMLAWKKNDKRTPALMIELIDIYKHNSDELAIDCLLLLAEHCLRNTAQSQGYLEEAEILIRAIPKLKTPKKVLEAKVMYCKALGLAKKGMLRDACNMYIDCLMYSDVYDPETRKKCLEELRAIYAEFNAPTEFIEKLLEDFIEKEKDVLFLVDYSVSMNGHRIKKTIEVIENLINYLLKKNDRIGYSVFNKTCKIVFNLTQKGLECNGLIKQIKKFDCPKGSTAFYDAILLSLKEMQAYKLPEEGKIPFDTQVTSMKKRSHWIVALIDGEDNASQVGFRQIKRKIQQSGINLAIIGLAISQAQQVLMRELSESTHKGIYIDCPNLSEIEKAFYLLSVVISSRADGIESLD